MKTTGQLLQNNELQGEVETGEPLKQKKDLSGAIAQLRKILDYVKAQDELHDDLVKKVQPHYRESARNLIHYLALRTFDLRPLQAELSMMSISSLGHSEGYTLTNLRKILQLLKMIGGGPIENIENHFHSQLNYYRSKQQLRQNTRNLFGQGKRDHTKIMVTMGIAAASDYLLIKNLLNAGMDIARINTSHENQEIWQSMIKNIRQAQVETGKDCLLYMDLAGPKLRTKKIDPIHVKLDKKNRKHLWLQDGDLIRLVRRLPQVNLEDSKFELGPPHITVTLPEIFDDVREGQRISFDDGKITGKIVEVIDDAITISIINTMGKPLKLMEDKGINVPDTKLRLPSITKYDHKNIPFIARHADIVGYSFVHHPRNVEQLQKELKRLGREDIGIVLKIETKEAFENLPMLLLTAMRSPKVGVMIARGDLAVEIGFERISEVQEEILWICEAAHIPGIWATEVLDKLAQKGAATRAEITDAAMAARAECVMLNKGPCIVTAVATLKDIILRMEQHQFKRKSYLRPLQVARGFLSSWSTISV